MSLPIHIEKYRLNLGVPEEAAQYAEIERRAKALGHKLFDSSSMRKDISTYLKNLPTVFYVETDYLFKNQYNTEEGHRIFDWSEEIYPNRDIKEGYFITSGVDELREAKNNQLACGYCGARYDASKTDAEFCHKCLDSEYLTEDSLYMLRLRNVFNENRPKGIPSFLKAAYEEGRKVFNIKQAKKKKEKAAQLLIDLEERQKLERYETQVKHDLLMVDINPDNLIYHKHSDTWSYGWRKKVTIEEFNTYRQKIADNCEHIARDEVGIAIYNKMERGRGI
tara:strand:+ start:654 stop:1490 length:837 start_codon:yes stop_codon:yes gene_type:complete